MFITGPDVIKTVTGEDVTMEELGGARTHNTKSGNAHYMGSDEEDAIEYVKALLSYLPQNNLDEPPSYDEPADLEVSDLDTGARHADPGLRQPALRHAHGDRGGRSTTRSSSRSSRCSRRTSSSASAGSRAARSASSPTSRCSSPACLDIDASEKAARFVRTCDAFNIPVLTFVDVPGFLPGTDQEWNGIIRRGAKLIYAYAEATVPLVTVITRKAYGGAYDVMGSKHLGADINVAWPTAQIAVMGAQGAVNILYRNEIEEAVEAGNDAERRAELIPEYEDTLANPYIAAERGYIDAVIMPARDPLRDRPLAAAAALQARDAAAQEAREHPALMTDRRAGRSRCCGSSTPTRRPRRSPPWWRSSPRSGRRRRTLLRGVRPSGPAGPPHAHPRSRTAPAAGAPAACPADLTSRPSHPASAVAADRAGGGSSSSVSKVRHASPVQAGSPRRRSSGV